MKTVQLSKGEKISTRALIDIVVDSPRPNQGIDMAEMRKRDRISKALAKVPPDGTELVLEDADFALLADLVSTFKFGMRSEDLLAFGQAIDDAKK